MSSPRWRKGVESLQIDNKEGFNDSHSHNNLARYSSRSFGNGPEPWYTTFFRRLPLIGFFANAMQAIEKLESLSEGDIGGSREGVVKQGDVGFKELCKILRENKVSKGEIKMVKLEERRVMGGGAMFGVRITAEFSRHLHLVDDKGLRTVREEIFDPAKIIRELTDRLEIIARRRLAYIMLIVIALWLALNLYLQFFVYR